MKKKIKSFGFWTALAGAVATVVTAVGKCCGWTVNGSIASDVVLAIAGLLVVLGVVTMPKKEGQEENKDNEDITNKQEDDADKE